jgi:hypothetical protein
MLVRGSGVDSGLGERGFVRVGGGGGVEVRLAAWQNDVFKGDIRALDDPTIVCVNGTAVVCVEWGGEASSRGG